MLGPFERSNRERLSCYMYTVNNNERTGDERYITCDYPRPSRDWRHCPSSSSSPPTPPPPSSSSVSLSSSSPTPVFRFSDIVKSTLHLPLSFSIPLLETCRIVSRRSAAPRLASLILRPVLLLKTVSTRQVPPTRRVSNPQERNESTSSKQQISRDVSSRRF